MTTKKVTKKKTVKKKATVKLGRPTKYKPEYCKKVIEVMAKGFSKEAVAGHLEINKDTLYEWEKRHKDFSDALKHGVELSRKFWEEIALNHLVHNKGSNQLNSTVWIFNMKNRFNWTDKAEVKTEDKTESAKRTFAFDLSDKPAE